MEERHTALVTGATKGIGLALSRHLHRAGWNVIGIARNAIEDFPGQLLTADLANVQETESVLARLSASSKIDAVVNNAGIAIPQRLEALDLHSLQAVFDLNVRSAVQVTQACLPSLKRSSAGRIVNVCRGLRTISWTDSGCDSQAAPVVDRAHRLQGQLDAPLVVPLDVRV